MPPILPPPPRPEVNDAQLKPLARALADYYGLRRTCVDCLHFNSASEECDLYHQRPPARIIARGCDSFEDDIPF